MELSKTEKRRQIQKRYREKNREKLKLKNKEYREKNKELIKERNKNRKSVYDKQYYEKHKEKVLKQKRLYYENNKKCLLEKNTRRDKERKKIDPMYRLSKNLRTRLRYYLDENSTKHKTKKLISCSIVFYRKWLEFQFDPYTNWENYGSYWCIDHVIPMKKFDLSKNDEIFKCMHWSNLRPLEKNKNSEKSDKYNNRIKIFLI